MVHVHTYHMLTQRDSMRINGQPYEAQNNKTNNIHLSVLAGGMQAVTEDTAARVRGSGRRRPYRRVVTFGWIGGGRAN